MTQTTTPADMQAAATAPTPKLRQGVEDFAAASLEQSQQILREKGFDPHSFSGRLSYAGEMNFEFDPETKRVVSTTLHMEFTYPDAEE